MGNESSAFDKLPVATRITIEMLEEQCCIVEKTGESSEYLAIVRRNLKRWAEERAALVEWAQRPCSVKGEFFCMSAIWADGWGDYFALLQAAGLLRKHIPSLDIYCIFQHKRNLPNLDLNDFGLTTDQLFAFQETDLESSQILEPVLAGQERAFAQEILVLQNEIALDEASQTKRVSRIEALDVSIEEARTQLSQLERQKDQQERALVLRERLLKSRGILHMSLALDTFSDPALRSKSMYYAEIGNFQGMENAFQLNWYCMGLLPFEDGLFLVAEQAELENHYVAHFNWHKKSQQVFLYFLALRHRDEALVLYMPVQALDNLQMDGDWLRQHGVSQMTYQDEKIDLQPTGTIIEIRNPFPLPIKQFRQLIAGSQQIVGCTGDGSLGDCLAAGRLPFYEMRPHKIGVIEGLLTQVRVIAPEAEGLTRYFEVLSHMLQDSTDPKECALDLHEALMTSEWEKSWPKVIREIHRHYNLEQNLVARVKHLLSHPPTT